MPTMPYLHFQGQCAEALAFYAQVFRGKDLQMMPYGSAPEALEAWKSSERVMHGQISIYDGTLMASDYPPGVAGDGQAGFSVMQAVPDVVEAARVFAALAFSGHVIDPFRKTFFSSGFGMVKDRFGTHWIISAQQE